MTSWVTIEKSHDLTGLPESFFHERTGGSGFWPESKVWKWFEGRKLIDVDALNLLIAKTPSVASKRGRLRLTATNAKNSQPVNRRNRSRRAPADRPAAAGLRQGTAGLPPTPANVAYAARMRQEILGKIERGNFILAEYLPDGLRVKQDVSSLTWKQLGAEWLAIKSKEIEHSTAHHYAQTLNSYHFDDWNAKHLGDLDFRQLKAQLAALPTNPKTFNNIASVIKLVTEYGYKAKLLREPLHNSVDMRRLQKPKPVPLTLAEDDLVLSKVRDPRGVNFYEFALFTGLRPSEQIALR